MNTDTRTVEMERELPYPPEKIWRALTEPHLLAEWLMKTDFQPEAGHVFQFRGDWGAVDCRVLTIEPNKVLAYSWDAMGLESTVTWTLTSKGGGTLLRMAQTGFTPDQTKAFQGAKYGWQMFFGKLEELLAKPG